MSDPYHVGDEILLTGTFTDPVTGAVKDPTTAKCAVLKPDGTIVNLSPPTKLSTGVYQASFVPTVPGDHWYSFKGDGAATRYEDTILSVLKQRVPPP